MTKYNRTDAARALLREISIWCVDTGTKETVIGHVLFMHPGFVGLLRKRLTVSEETEAAVRGFLFEHSKGWRGQLPKTHNGRAGRRAGGIRNADLAEQRIVPPTNPVDRDPCSFCGVRSDFGCRHQQLGNALLRIEDPVARKIVIMAKRQRGELTDQETEHLIRSGGLEAA